MICRHCKEEVTKVFAYRPLQIRKEITIVDGECFVAPEDVLEYPRGKIHYHFRCGHCGGDLGESSRDWVHALRREAR